MNMLSTLVQNIKAGTRLALILPVDRSAFRASVSQMILLLALLIPFDALYDYVFAELSGNSREFDLSVELATTLLFLCSAYLIAHIQRAPDSFVAFVVIFASPTPIVIVVCTVFLWPLENYGPVNERDWALGIYGLIVVAAAFGWLVAIIYRGVRLLYSTSRRRTWALVAVVMVFTVAEVLIQPDSAFWEDDVTEIASAKTVSETAQDRRAKEFWAEYKKLDVENTYYAQPGLMARATESLAPQRPGVVDLYFIAFGSYAYQNVFQSETRAVRMLLDERFDTAGRSLVLVNSLLTVKNEPLANANNLRHAIRAVARRMDPEEDILFLFLTSHGSKGHALSVDFWPLQLNDLHHHDLARLLDDAGIKWRVVVVSACYSGGFIETLKNEYSLVMTASRSDRNSFGCSNELAFTYFGKAYFDEQLRRRFSFTEAFYLAAEAIKNREASERLTPSVPQMHVGHAIAPKLDALESRLRNLKERANR